MEINKRRLEEIATMALHKLLEDDADHAQRFMVEEMDMSKEEADFFGVVRFRQAYDINWVTDGEDVDLPSEVDIPWDVFDDDIENWLSDTYGFFVDNYVLETEED